MILESIMSFVVLFPAVTTHWVPILCLLQAHLEPLHVQTLLEQQLSLFIIVLLSNSQKYYN